jgi:hypothetical protein
MSNGTAMPPLSALTIDYARWCWLADDGRIYSGKSQTVITDSDPDYLAFTAAGGVPTRWPEDESGNQTDASMAEVVAPAGLAVGKTNALLNYAAKLRLARETAGIVFNGKRIATDRESQARVDSALGYVLQEPSATISWKTSDGFVELDAQAMTLLAKQVGEHVQGLFNTEASVAKKIEAGQITSTQQIDADF